MSDPYRGCQLRCVADEPYVAVVLARTGLARCRTTDIRTTSGTLCDDSPKHVVRGRGYLRADRPLTLGLDIEEHLVVWIDNLGDCDGIVMYARIGKSAVCGCHLERRDISGTEGHGGVLAQRCFDSHLLAD